VVVGTAGGAHVDAKPIVADDDGEPIFRAVQRGWQNIETEWNRANLHPGLRVAVIVGLILLLVANAGWWVPMLFLTLICYGVYWVVRALVVRPGKRGSRRVADSAARGRQQQVAARSEQVAYAAARPSARKLRRRQERWHRREPDAFVVKAPKQKLAELTGSMLLAAAIVLTMTLVMMILHDSILDGAPWRPEQFAWMALIGMFGAWAVMVPSKVWEDMRGDQTPRRFVMLVVGLATGAVAFGLAGALMVELPHNGDIGGTGPLSLGFYDPRGSPKAMAYLAYFGFLLLILRWWRQADPARSARLSLWTTGSCVFWAWLLSQFWQFPQPWGLMLAAVISVSVQLSSPWAPPRRPSVRLEEG